MGKTYKGKSKEEKVKEVEELLSRAKKGIENCFNSPEEIKEMINYMSRFYNYSFRNTFLIQEQFEGAMAVGSYTFWKEKGFTVNKGEKGIKILAPTKLGDRFENESGEVKLVSKASDKEKSMIRSGEFKIIEGRVAFKQGYVFDVSQTNAKAEDLPKIFPNRWLDGEVKDYKLMYKAMERIAEKIGVKIIAPKSELGAVKGVSYTLTKEVALNPRNTELQNIKTLAHELAHAKLHTKETTNNYSVNAKEFQAELTAYAVCSYFGLDTSEYSFRYIKSWTDGIELKDKEKLLNEVRETTKEYIEIIEDTLINSNNIEFKNNLGESSKDMISKDKEKEIRKKIREHEEWINSKGTRGNQLNLENENLSGMMLLNMDLRNANLKNADITQCVIFADLRGANLEGAKIDNTKWTGSNISKITIEANKLNLIEYQLEQEGCKHTEARKSLKTNRKDVELER